MKTYVKNILCYLVALLGLLAFIAMFSTPLETYDEVKEVWYAYRVKAYVGEAVNNIKIYNGSALPIVGFITPLICGLILIIESFQPSWGKKASVINTIMVVLFFVSSILVLLTKELFLNANNLGENINIRNGTGPVFSAICSALSGLILLFVTYFPSKSQMEYIQK